MTADRTILMEQAIKPSYESTKFPEERDYPLVCTWNVKVFSSFGLRECSQLFHAFLARWIRPADVPASRWNWTNAVDYRTKTSAPKDTSAFPHSWTKPSKFDLHFLIVYESENNCLCGHRICGRIDSIPAFHWYVEDQQPNDVSIMMKNIGINDGFSEGLAFTLQGENCDGCWVKATNKMAASGNKWN